MVFPERLVADRFALVAERANGVQVAAHGKTIAKNNLFLQTIVPIIIFSLILICTIRKIYISSIGGRDILQYFITRNHL
jgi:hypothetical protein